MPALKSGSRAQQVPEGANTGFASAANLWRAQESQVVISNGQPGETTDKPALVHEKQQGRTSRKKSTGKLSRPKKTSIPQNESVTAAAESGVPLLEDMAEAPQLSVAGPGQGARRSPSNNGRLPQDVTVSHRASINPSEYSVDADNMSDNPLVRAKKASMTAKPARRRAIKASETGETSTGKKPRKEPRKVKHKSEAIILDSDEPEEVLPEIAPAEAKGLTSAQEIASKKSLTKTAEVIKEPDNKKPGRIAKQSTLVDKPGSPGHSATESSEQSTYFAQPKAALGRRRSSASPPPAPLVDHVALPKNLSGNQSRCTDIVSVEMVNEHAPPAGELAPKRRRSWTPVKNLSENNNIPLINHELNEKVDRIPFSEMLGSFSYLQAEAPPAQRAISGEGCMKRRRVELSKTPTLPQPLDPSMAQTRTAPKTTKRAEAPKKAQTITALATAAFQPPAPVNPEQSTVSAFFPAQKETEMAPIAEDNAEALVNAKQKKPRKPRAKAKAVDDAALPSKTTKTKAKSKAKVGFDSNDHQSPLFSPSQARKQMKSQDFLFGTSSQLAAEESPDFIREIQLAVRQSEALSSMPSGSQSLTQIEHNPLCDERSSAKVPTAPHGTCLSLEQAHRELWCASARNAAGATLAQEAQETPLDEVFAGGKRETQLNECCETSLGTQNSKPFPTVSLLSKPNDEIKGLKNSVVTNTVSVDEESYQSNVQPKPATLEDEWVLLRSDESEILPQLAANRSPDRSAALASIPVRRTALQALDANISIAIQDLGNKSTILGQNRAFSTATPVCVNKSPTKERSAGNEFTLAPKSLPRGRGRPRKDTSANSSPTTSPARGRGRPRKDTSANISPTTSSARGRGRPRKNSPADTQPLTSPARGRGRPRKQPSADKAARTSPVRGPGRPRKVVSTDDLVPNNSKRPVGRPRKDNTEMVVPPRAPSKGRAASHAMSTSQSVQQEEWTNIDEISDSDSPATPSPRRRRASSSPAFVRPLDFTSPRSPSPKPKATTSGVSSLKATDPIWPSVQANIYPKISQAIKSAPSGGEMNAPSWHEKILLYDPIVLEDLTAWLNGQGLQTELTRLKPKTKTRGRKKKDAPPEVDEWEVVRDELKAWMVQKWCEDQSICCLWKEGLRGGVKARY